MSTEKAMTEERKYGALVWGELDCHDLWEVEPKFEKVASRSISSTPEVDDSLPTDADGALTIESLRLLRDEASRRESDSLRRLRDEASMRERASSKTSRPTAAALAALDVCDTDDGEFDAREGEKDETPRASEHAFPKKSGKWGQLQHSLRMKFSEDDEEFEKRTKLALDRAAVLRPPPTEFSHPDRKELTHARWMFAISAVLAHNRRATDNWKQLFAMTHDLLTREHRTVAEIMSGTYGIDQLRVITGMFSRKFVEMNTLEQEEPDDAADLLRSVELSPQPLTTNQVEHIYRIIFNADEVPIQLTTNPNWAERLRVGALTSKRPRLTPVWSRLMAACGRTEDPEPMDDLAEVEDDGDGVVDAAEEEELRRMTLMANKLTDVRMSKSTENSGMGEVGVDSKEDEMDVEMTHTISGEAQSEAVKITTFGQRAADTIASVRFALADNSNEDNDDHEDDEDDNDDNVNGDDYNDDDDDDNDNGNASDNGENTPPLPVPPGGPTTSEIPDSRTPSHNVGTNDGLDNEATRSGGEDEHANLGGEDEDAKSGGGSKGESAIDSGCESDGEDDVAESEFSLPQTPDRLVDLLDEQLTSTLEDMERAHQRHLGSVGFGARVLALTRKRDREESGIKRDVGPKDEARSSFKVAPEALPGFASRTSESFAVATARLPAPSLERLSTTQNLRHADIAANKRSTGSQGGGSGTIGSGGGGSQAPGAPESHYGRPARLATGLSKINVPRYRGGSPTANIYNKQRRDDERGGSSLDGSEDDGSDDDFASQRSPNNMITLYVRRAGIKGLHNKRPLQFRVPDGAPLDTLFNAYIKAHVSDGDVANFKFTAQNTGQVLQPTDVPRDVGLGGQSVIEAELLLIMIEQGGEG